MMRASLLAAAVVLSLGAASPLARAADTKAECIAAADQGQSLRDDGKYTRAREEFATCARETCPKVVAHSCNQWLHETDEATPTVVLGAKDAAGQDLTNAQVTMDGSSFAESLDGKPVQVDPGQHLFRFTRPGSDPAQASVVLRAGEKNRVVGVTLNPTVTAAVEPPASPPPAGEREPGPSFLSARNVTALSMLVLGGAAIGGGVYFLAQSGSQSGTASSLRGSMPDYACTDAPTSTACQQLSSAVDSQHRDATVGTVMVVGGGVLAAGAVVAWIVWPKQEPTTTGLRLVTPVLRPGAASLELEGGF
jgi:hypothetical protein